MLLLTSTLLAPELAMAHGAVDTPISRQTHCRALEDFWWGNPSDLGCEAVTLINGYYPGQQWNEVAHLIPNRGYEDLETVKREVPDGKLCSAGDSKKDALDGASNLWTSTDVRPVNGMMDVRIIATAPHVPSFARVFLTKPGFDPTKSVLTWNNLTLIHTEQLTASKTDWGDSPPKIPASGYFKFPVPIPPGQTGKAILFVQWQRIDPAGEGFYNCSDINIIGTAVPGSWFKLGQFIDKIMDTLKPGDSVHFRILDNTPAAKEVVDIKLLISASNLDPKIWGQQLANQVNATDIAKVGEKKADNTIVFNTTDPGANSVYAVAKGYSQAMSIIEGEGPGPVNPAPPMARITGPTALKSGETFTFSGTTSTGSNGPLLYQWAVPGMTGAQNGATITGKAYAVTEATKFKARLNVRDQKNGKTGQAELSFTVEPASGDTDYPKWIRDGGYNSGSKVSNHGMKFECKQGAAGAWCGQNENEPGKPGSTFWQRAWDVK